MKKGIWIILFIALCGFVAAQVPIEPISRTDNLIKDQHEHTRDWCQEQWQQTHQDLAKKFDSEKDSLLKYYNQIMWFDRVFTAILIFCAVLLGSVISNFILRKHQRREKQIFEQYLRSVYKGGQDGRNGK